MLLMLNLFAIARRVGDIMPMYLNFIGLDELKEKFKLLENVPLKVIRDAAFQAMKPILTASREAAPVRTGNLRKGIKMFGERPIRRRGWRRHKYVFTIVFDKKMNDVFQKPSINGIKNSKGIPVAYYPVSQEYGWQHRYWKKIDGVKTLVPGKKITGKLFVHNTMAAQANQARKTMIDSLNSYVDAQLRLKHLLP